MLCTLVCVGVVVALRSCAEFGRSVGAVPWFGNVSLLIPVFTRPRDDVLHAVRSCTVSAPLVLFHELLADWTMFICRST